MFSRSGQWRLLVFLLSTLNIFQTFFSYFYCFLLNVSWAIYNSHQASAYEARDRTRTPLHTPKTLETCKKSTPCLIQKASRCAADRTSKTTFFIFHFLCNTKIVRENHVYLFVIWLVQWWKLYYIYIFFTQRTTDFDRLKRNMNDGTIVFLTSLLIALTWKILLLFSFWYKIISCFKEKVYSFLSTLAIK